MTSPMSRVSEIVSSQIGNYLTNKKTWSIYVNVRDYGAKGDGTTNDTVAFAEAMADCFDAGGGIVIVPEGNYIATVKVRSNCGIIGTGRISIIKLPNNTADAAVGLYDGNVRNIYLNNFSIDGNKANQTSSSARGLYINGNTTIPVSTNPVETRDVRHYVRDVFIVNTKGVGFEVQGRGESIYDGVQVTLGDDTGCLINAPDNWFCNISSGDNKGHGISITSSNNRMVNSKAWNNGLGNTGLTAGYGFYLFGADNVYVQGESQGNLLDGVYMSSVRLSTVDVFCDANGKRDAIVSAGVSGFTLLNSIENIVRGTVKNRTATGEILQNYAVSLTGTSVRNIINVTAELMAIGAFFDSGNNMPLNILNITGTDLSGNPIYSSTKLNTTTKSLTTATTWAQINSFMPDKSVVVVQPTDINTSLLPTGTVSWGTVTIYKYNGGRLSAFLSSNVSGVVTCWVGAYNNSTAVMEWKLTTPAGGRATLNGNGTKLLTIPHGLGYTPTLFNVLASSVDAGTAIVNYVTADVSNLNVNFTNNTTVGTANIALSWSAR